MITYVVNAVRNRLKYYLPAAIGFFLTEFILNQLFHTGFDTVSSILICIIIFSEAMILGEKYKNRSEE